MCWATAGMMAWLLAASVAGAEEPRTPETRTLTAQEASQAMERDWLFQAMGEPLEQRAIKEIDWAWELAERLARHTKAPDLSSGRDRCRRRSRTG
jgi:hypothetical protein